MPDAEFANILSVMSALGEPAVELADRIPERRQDWIEVVIEGSLGVKLPTMWTDEKQREE